MYKGAQTYTYRDFISDRREFETSLRRVKAIGYESLQHGTPPFMTPEETKAMLDDVGLIPCSSGADYRQMGDPAEVRKAIQTARVYGVKYIYTGSIPMDQAESADGYKRFAETLNGIGREFIKEGCYVTYHHHAMEFYSLGSGRTGMDVLFEEADPSCVMFCLDTHWLAAGGVEVDEWILKMKNRTPIIHFKDYAIGGGAAMVEGVSKRYAEVGEGNLNWPKIVAACRAANVEHAVFEQDDCLGDPFDSMVTSYNNMVKFGV